MKFIFAILFVSLCASCQVWLGIAGSNAEVTVKFTQKQQKEAPVAAVKENRRPVSVNTEKKTPSTEPPMKRIDSMRIKYGLPLPQIEN